MKFGLILLGLLCLVSVLGSIIPQGRDESFYLSNYSPLWAQVIISFKLSDIYHSTGFIALFSALCTNLFLCSTIRLKSLIGRIKRSSLPPSKSRLANPVSIEESYSPDNINDIFTSQGFKNIRQVSSGRSEIYYSAKNKIGYLGSWLIHLGILAIIIFYSYGQYTIVNTAVYGVAGSIEEIEETNYIMHIEDFNINYRQDGSVQQYVTEATLSDRDGNDLVSGQIYVNKPMRYKGYTFYQHSTGWASRLNVLKNEENISNDVIYDGGAYINDEDYIIVQMHHLYPDFIATESGFASKSNDLNNPKILYSILYGGQRVDMNIVSPDEDIAWQDFTFRFTNPQRYTYLSVNKMRGKTGAMFGSVLIILGLFLAFYMKPKQLIVEMTDDKIYIYGDHSPEVSKRFRPGYESEKNISI